MKMQIYQLFKGISKKNILQSEIIVFVIITLSSLILYFHSFFHKFVQDDFVIMESIMNGINLGNTFISAFFMGNFYRPFSREVLFYISYNIFHLNTLGYHLVIFIVFLLNAFIVYKIIKFLSKSTELSLIISALFFVSRGLHFTELYWISAGFQETFTAFFILSTCLLFIYYLQKGNKYIYIISIGLAIFALLSKESAIILPLLLLLLLLIAFYYYKIEKCLKLKSLIINLIPFAIILGIYLLRLFTLHLGGSGAYGMSFNLATALNNITFYVYNSFNGVLDAVFLIPIIFLAFFSKYWKMAFFGVAWFLICIFPYLFW